MKSVGSVLICRYALAHVVGEGAAQPRDHNSRSEHHLWATNSWGLGSQRGFSCVSRTDYEGKLGHNQSFPLVAVEPGRHNPPMFAQIPGPVDPARPEKVFAAFAVFWIALSAAGFLFFHFNRNAALKRRIFPIFVITAAILFGSFIQYTSAGHTQILFLAIPMILLVSLLTLRRIGFCSACGRTIYERPVFSGSPPCPHCGAEYK